MKLLLSEHSNIDFSLFLYFIIQTLYFVIFLFHYINTNLNCRIE